MHLPSTELAGGLEKAPGFKQINTLIKQSDFGELHS